MREGSEAGEELLEEAEGEGSDGGEHQHNADGQQSRCFAGGGLFAGVQTVDLSVTRSSSNLIVHLIAFIQGDAATNSVPMIGRRGERRDSADEGREPTFSGQDQKRGD